MLVRNDDANLSVLRDLLGNLDARDSRRRPLPAVMAALQDGGSTRLRTTLGGFDVMTEIPAEGDFSYSALESRAVSIRMRNHSIRVAAIDDLVEMKHQAHRAKDLARLPELRRIQELKRRQSPGQKPGD